MSYWLTAFAGFALLAAAQQEGVAPRQDFEGISRAAAGARQAGRLEEAVRFYRQAVQLDSKWQEGWWYLGTLLYSADRTEEASEAFSRLLALRPNDGEAWTFLGLCAFEQNDHERALKALLQARAYWASDNLQLLALARYHLGILLNRFGSHQQAYEMLGVLARDKRDDPGVIAALGAAVLLRPELPSEIPEDKRELVLAAGRVAYLAAQVRKDEARKGYENLVARYPSAPGVNYAFGAFLLEFDPESAAARFRRELEIDPACAYARVQVALNLVQAGDYEAAAAQARQAVELRPEWFMPHQVLGRALLSLSKVQAAIEELAESARLAPENPQTRFYLARAYRQSGRTEVAAREEAEFKRLFELERTTRFGRVPSAAAPGNE